MSVAEFSICIPIVIAGAAGVHELFRIQAAENTINLIAEARAAELSYSGLRDILDGTFSSPVPPQQKTLEKRISHEVTEVLQKSMLAWSFSNADTKAGTLSGIKVSVTGPTFQRNLERSEIKIHVCLKSWLEPLMRVLSDRRNCLGQFASNHSAGGSRGISLIGFASREASISLIPYFDHVGKKARPYE